MESVWLSVIFFWIGFGLNLLPRLPASLSRRAFHPHLCGEHYEMGLVESILDGSSSPMWGTCVEFRQVDV